jgi:4-amino-4-deoxy-L-arabinose transferase-like glycosyltransferase
VKFPRQPRRGLAEAIVTSTGPFISFRYQTTYNVTTLAPVYWLMPGQVLGTRNQMSKRVKIGLILLISAAAALRLGGLFANTFHADEALFATWARQIAVWRDPVLAGQLVDKPPLLFYLQALFYPLAGPTEWAARLPNFIASILLVPLSGMLSWRLFRNGTVAILAAAIITFSPLLIQFSATGFTDPLLTTLIVLSIYIATGSLAPGKIAAEAPANNHQRWALLSGLVFGLSIATKYQALLILPLTIGLFYIFGWRRSLWLRWFAGASVVLVILALWEIIRTGSPEIWEAQISSYGGLRVAWSWELWPRIQAWTGQWRFLLGSSMLAVSILVLAIPYLVSTTIIDDEYTSIDQLLAIYVLSYFTVHWLIAVPIWDRYLLVVAPYFSILAARIIWRIYSYVKLAIRSGALDRRYSYYLLGLTMMILAAIQVPDISSSYQGELPIGGRPDADGGIAEASILLRKQPPGTVLYDHWYSWQWRYHLFDSNVYISWFPNPQSLADDLQVFGNNDDARFVALPNSAEALPVFRAVRSAGFDLELATGTSGPYERGPIELYRLVNQ